MAFVGLLSTSCQSDDDTTGVSVANGEQTSVKFELDAGALNYTPAGSSLRFTPVYSKDAFSIYAFRQIPGGTDYLYEKTINLANMEYMEADKKLVGTDLLTIGTYKFITAYGLSNQSDLLTLPDWTDNKINNIYNITYKGGTTPLSEIFLQDGPVDSLPSYTMGTTSSANPTVTATLKRAVSRVDIMFLKGKKNADGTYTESAYREGNNVFGKKTLEQLQLRYKTLNNKMSFFGENLTTTAVNANINLSDFSNIITIGSSSATKVGNDTFIEYDNIKTTDIIYGGAHVFGNYLFANNNADKTTSLELYIKPENGIGRTINVSVDNDHFLPVEKNKVTLVKIYVIDNNDPTDPEDPDPDPDPDEPNVFTTNVMFEVEIETTWDGSNEVTGEIN